MFSQPKLPFKLFQYLQYKFLKGNENILKSVGAEFWWGSFFLTQIRRQLLWVKG